MPEPTYRYYCRAVGCRTLVLKSGIFCEKHQDLRRFKEPHRGSASQRGYGNRWQKARASYLRAHPLCNACGAVATLVDHIVPHEGDMALFWDNSNWQPLCRECHDKKTRKESMAKVSKRIEVMGG